MLAADWGMMDPDARVGTMTSRRSEDAGVAVRAPAAPSLDPRPPGQPDSPDATDPHRALVESLVELLERSAEQVEELLSLMHEELDADGPLEEQVADAFERGLQLGLMVGLGSSELALPPRAAGAEGSAPVSR